LIIIMMILLLFISVFASDFIDIDCSKPEDCTEGYDAENHTCDECKLGCTPTSSQQRGYSGAYKDQACRPFGCKWQHIVFDGDEQEYDISCNFDQIQEWAPLMEVDPECVTTPTTCGKFYLSSGAALTGLSLYRQKENDCAENSCPSTLDIMPTGTTCTATCRADQTPNTRTCEVPQEKLQTCRRTCSEGNLKCPDFTCYDLQATWTGHLKGGRFDACFNNGLVSCGKNGDSCCSNSALGIGSGDDDIIGRENGCDSCTCGRRCTKRATSGKKTNGLYKCTKWSTTKYCCSSASTLSFLIAVIATSFMF